MLLPKSAMFLSNKSVLSPTRPNFSTNLCSRPRCLTCCQVFQGLAVRSFFPACWILIGQFKFQARLQGLFYDANRRPFSQLDLRKLGFGFHIVYKMKEPGLLLIMSCLLPGEAIFLWHVWFARLCAVVSLYSLYNYKHKVKNIFRFFSFRKLLYAFELFVNLR